MTSPQLARTTPMGRLYVDPRRADPASIPETVPSAKATAMLRDGVLVPSITNVLSAVGGDLTPWRTRLITAAIAEGARDYPQHFIASPAAAARWAVSAPDRVSDAAADKGSRIHAWIEDDLNGLSPAPLIDDEMRYVAAYRSFMADFTPVVEHPELTTFGTTAAGSFAGTADFVADINNKRTVGDWKTGKSARAEACLQLAALAHADTWMVPGADASHDARPAEPIEAATIVHLGPNRYTAYAVNDIDTAWELFCHAHSLWMWHHTHDSRLDRSPAIATPMTPATATVAA